MYHINHISNLNACIFDLDGTLLDSMNIWQEVDRKYLASFGIQFEQRFSEDIKRLTFNESAKYFIDTFHIPRSEKEIMSDWNQMVEVEYKENVQLKDGVKEVLHALYNKKIPMCIATACNKRHAQMALERLDILSYFTFIKTCKEANKNKEYPDIYLQCASEMNVYPSKVMVFEDLLMALKVAKQAGFRTCGIHDGLSSHESNQIKDICDIFIHDFHELKIR